MEDWRARRIPVPPRWRHQQGEEERSQRLERGHHSQRQPAKGQWIDYVCVNGGARTNEHTELARQVQQVGQGRLLGGSCCDWACAGRGLADQQEEAEEEA